MLKKLTAMFVLAIIMVGIFALPASAEKYELNDKFKIEIPDKYSRSSSSTKSNSSVVDVKAWTKTEGNNQYIIMTQVAKNTNKVNVKKASKSDVQYFENVCTTQLTTQGYKFNCDVKKEKVNGKDVLHIYLSDVTAQNGAKIYGDMYIYTTKKHAYFVYFVTNDNAYMSSLECKEVLNSFKITEKGDFLGGNLLIYIAVVVVAAILIIVIIASKSRQRTVYMNNPAGFGNYQQPYNSFNQQNQNQYGNNQYQQQSTNQYGNNQYQQPTTNQNGYNQYGNSSYQQPNSYNQQSSYPMSGTSSNSTPSTNGYGSTSQQNTSDWLSSSSKPADPNDPNKLADEFWNNK